MLEILAAIIKALGYAAALTCAGTVISDATLRMRGPEPLARAQTGLARWTGAALAAIACGSAYLFLERLGTGVEPAALNATFLSPLGLALGLQLAGGLWIAFAAGRAVAILGALAILVAFGVVGHAASRGLAASNTVLLHVVAVAWWLGGLWHLLFASRVLGDEAFSAQVARFSRQAGWVVAALLASALLTAALVLEFHFDIGLAYERGLLSKVGLTLALLALASVNKLVLSPRLAAEPGARSWLRRAIVGEVLIISGVLATTAFLTTHLSPHDRSSLGAEHARGSEINGPITFIDPWAPATPGGANTGAGYMVIANGQPIDDRLVDARSPWAEHVSLHVTTRGDGIARMRKPATLVIGAGRRLALEPDAYHLMFTGLYTPFVEGDAVPLTLVFERAGEVGLMLDVRPLGGRRHEH